MALTDSLISYWALDEANGSRADKVVASANTLADNATVTSNPGIVYSTAGQFTRVNGEYLSHADNASLSTGNIDFTMAGWFYATTISGGPYYAVGKAVASGNQYEWFVRLSSSHFQFWVTHDGTAPSLLLVTDTTTLSAATWYLVVVWHDSVANTINIKVNNGTAISGSANASGVFDSTAPFEIGRYNNDNSNVWDGRIGPVAFWKRALTPAEITQVYNSGNGLTYAAMVGNVVLPLDILTESNSSNWNDGGSVIPLAAPVGVLLDNWEGGNIYASPWVFRNRRR